MERKCFFGDNGLTSTSANHIANLAKEKISQLEEQLNRISFLQVTISLIGSSEKSVIESGITEEELNSIPDKIKEIAECKSLIAWLREAIKAKEELYNTERKREPEYDLVRPTKDHVLTEYEYYESLPINERNRYYSLEAKAATIGKIIHPKGSYSTARKELDKRLVTPNTYEGSGRDTTIYGYLPTVDRNKVETIFFDLQNTQRNLQAELNSMKFACEQAIKESQRESDAKYYNELRDYNSKLEQIDAEFQKQKNENLAAIDKLKIVIPDSLMSIFNTIKSL